VVLSTIALVLAEELLHMMLVVSVLATIVLVKTAVVFPMVVE
jgi:hypothetical protein